MRWRILRVPAVLGVSCLLPGCAAGLSPQGEAAQVARQNREAQLQVQTAMLRTELDSMRQALLEKDRREAELWQGYMALMVRVNQLIEQQQRAQIAAEAAQGATQAMAIPSQTEHPVALRALLRAINRMNLSPVQKQSLIQLLSPPRAIDETNPWTGYATW